MYNVNDPVSGYSGIPTNMTTIATKLAGAGYSPHAIGKWDVGMATYTHTPAGRGFESWLGYFGKYTHPKNPAKTLSCRYVSEIGEPSKHYPAGI